MKELICIVCPNGCRLRAAISCNDGRRKVEVSGNKCSRGEKFAEAELTNPTRSLTTTVRTSFSAMPWLPVRTDGEIPKNAIPEAINQLRTVIIDRHLRCGEVIISDLVGTGINVIATSDL